MGRNEHQEPSLTDQIAGRIKRGIAEVVGSHELQQEGLAQEHEGNPARVAAEARAAVQGTGSMAARVGDAESADDLAGPDITGMDNRRATSRAPERAGFKDEF